MNNVGRIASKNWLSLVLIFLFTFSVSLVGARFVRSILVGNNQSVAETKTTNEDTPTPPVNIANAVKLQPIVNSWILETNNKVGVVIFDLDRNETVASHNPDEIFPTYGVNQLALTYDGYRRLDAGLEKADTNIGYEINYNDCLNLMLRESNDTCANLFLSNSERNESLINFYANLEIANTDNNAFTANDLSKLLQHIWKHEDLSLISWAKLQDSMLNQTANDSTVDWRQGLPSGFSTARVYSKASGEMDSNGNWITYSDLALVDFVKLNRHFAVVVIGENINDLSSFSRLGTLIEGKVLEEK